MHDIFHIFGKDGRRLALPIVALILIVAAAAYTDIKKYVDEASTWRNESSNAVFLLLPFAWIFLIAAVVLQERLPGTHQYWLTRPIAWWKLLLAKLLFAAVFINGVWFISDCVILSALHLPIPVPNLLLREVPLTGLLFLPAFCLASVSSGLGQIAIGLIVSVLGFLAEVLVPTFLYSRHSGVGFVVNRVNWFDGTWLWAILPLVLLAIGVLQYSRRATRSARCLFLVTVFGLVPFTLLLTLGGFPQGHSFEAFKADNRLPEVRLSFDVNPKRLATEKDRSFEGVQIPIQVTGLPSGVYVEGGGKVYLSGLGNEWGAFIYQRGSDYWLRLTIRDSDLAKLANAPVDVSASIDLSAFRVEKSQLLSKATDKTFSPAPGEKCRFVDSDQSPLFCWNGPYPTHVANYRVIPFSVVPGDVDFTRPANASPEYGLPWTFSPLVDWTFALPLKRDSGGRIQFLTIAPAGTMVRELHAGKIDLSPYIVKP